MFNDLRLLSCDNIYSLNSVREKLIAFLRKYGIHKNDDFPKLVNLQKNRKFAHGPRNVRDQL